LQILRFPPTGRAAQDDGAGSSQLRGCLGTLAPRSGRRTVAGVRAPARATPGSVRFCQRCRDSGTGSGASLADACGLRTTIETQAGGRSPISCAASRHRSIRALVRGLLAGARTTRLPSVAASRRECGRWRLSPTGGDLSPACRTFPTRTSTGCSRRVAGGSRRSRARRRSA
jgi:hypothetical protein